MRSTRVLGSLGAAAFALVLLLVWSRRSQDGAGTDSGPVEPAETLAATPRDPATDTEAAPAPATRPVEVAQRDPLESAAAPAPTCLVRVVAAASGAPLPAARLWIQNDDARWNDVAWWHAMRRFNDVEPVLAGGLGHEVVLDERGEARVPRPARKLAVAAALDAQHGEADLAPGAETCIVELKPYHALTVDVVDRSGRPIPRVFVALFWGESEPLEHTNVLRTDERGRLELAKLDNQIWTKDYRGPLHVTLAGGAPCEPKELEFTLDSVPQDPVRLVAAAFGSVVVQITDAQGNDLALEGTANFEIDTSPLADPSVALRAGANLYPPLEHGRAVFPCVGLGLSLDIRCYVEEYAIAGRELAGPTTEGEELVVPIPLTERNAIVRGHLSGTAEVGELLGRAEPRLDFHARVGADGAFVGYLRADKLEAADTPWTLRFEGESSAKRIANVVPRVDEDRNELDFGEVALVPLVTLASLHALDDHGAPVAAYVEVGPGSGLGGLWCDASGAAVLEGTLTNLPLRVRAGQHECLPSDWFEITAPGTEAVLTLRRAARLTGRVLLPEGANPERCEMALVLMPTDATRKPKQPWTEASADGSFEFAGCEPGGGRLVIAYDGLRIAERTGIALVAGTTTELPDIDLRTELQPFTLTVALASGAPWLGGHLEVRELDHGTTGWIVIGPSASAIVFSPRPSLDLWVAGRGARPTLFTGVSDGDRLVLPDAPSVVLRLAREIALPEPPLALLVRATRSRPEEVAFETDDDADGAPALVGADGRARLSVPWVGEYKLGWIVRHTETGAEWAVVSAAPQSVAIDDSSATTIVDARLTAAELSAALAEARGR